jgi:hypothetical protein
MYLTGFSGFPRWILRGLAADAMVRALDRKWLSGLYGLMNRAGDAAIVLSKGLRSLLRGDVGRIRRYVARATDRNQ